MPQLTLKHCYIADVEMDENGKDEKNRIVKINVNEEDFFEMLDHVNPKNIIKYLDMRGIPHRDALEVNVKPIDLKQLPERHTPQYGNAIRKLRQLEQHNQKKLNRVRVLMPEYNGKVSMTEYELDKICEKQTDCGCNCKKCEVFAQYIRSQER